MTTTSILSRRSIMTAVATIGAAAAAPALANPATTDFLPAADSKEAMVARAEQIADFLGSRYIREGWLESLTVSAPLSLSKTFGGSILARTGASTSQRCETGCTITGNRIG